MLSKKEGKEGKILNIASNAVSQTKSFSAKIAKYVARRK
jgi:hypothetical protein